MKKIAVTCEQEYISNPQKYRSLINTDYVEFVLKAGGSPFIVCPAMKVDEIADMMDGLLLTGGKDINPLMYNEDLAYTGAGNCNLIRDMFEKKLYKAFLRRGKPIFGICRGFQLIGIINNLSLIQEINKYKEVKIAHSQGGKEIPGTDPVHIMVNRGVFKELMDVVTPINSFHHQGFVMKNKTHKGSWIRDKEVVLGWARSNEEAKMLEGIIMQLPIPNANGEKVLVGGVQYHPERMIRGSIVDPDLHLAPFRYVMGMLDPEMYQLDLEEDEQKIEMEEKKV